MTTRSNDRWLALGALVMLIFLSFLLTVVLMEVERVGDELAELIIEQHRVDDGTVVASWEYPWDQIEIDASVRGMTFRGEGSTLHISQDLELACSIPEGLLESAAQLPMGGRLTPTAILEEGEVGEDRLP